MVTYTIIPFITYQYVVIVNSSNGGIIHLIKISNFSAIYIIINSLMSPFYVLDYIKYTY